MFLGFPCGSAGRPGFNPWVGKIPWRRARLPIPVFWPGESHGQSMGSQRVGLDRATFTFTDGCSRGWGVRLPMQETRVQSLVQEDSTHCGTTKACGPRLLSPQAAPPEARAPSTCAPHERSHHSEKPTHCNKRQPPLAETRESPCAARKTLCDQKKNLSILYIKPGQRECSG